MYKDLETYLSIKENKDRVRERNNKSDRSNQRPNNDIGGHDKNSEFYFKYDRMTQVKAVVLPRLLYEHYSSVMLRGHNLSSLSRHAGYLIMNFPNPVSLSKVF